MAQKFAFYNIAAANAEIVSAQEALKPGLLKAGITSIPVAGKTVPSAEAPLASQITALLAAAPVVADSQSAAEAIASNDLISRELTTVQTALATKLAAVDALTRSNADMQATIHTQTSTIQAQTAQIGVLTTQRDAGVNQFSAQSKELDAHRRALAQRCIDVGCLDLNKLGADASPEKKLGFVLENFTWEQMWDAHNGAVNAAFRKTGLNMENLPAPRLSGPGAERKSEPKGRERFKLGVKTMMGGAPLSAM